MRFDENDFKHLALSVRTFLAKADVVSRMSATPILYLELPDISTLRNMHVSILQSLPPEVSMSAYPQRSFWSYPDDHTIKYEPFAGVSIVLSCKQRFAVEMKGRSSVGYRDIAFVDATLPKTDET